MSHVVREHTSENAVIVDQHGFVLHNAFQMDDPIIVRDYDDGLRHVLSSKTGKPIIAPFDPKTVERVRCPHCNGELGG